MRRNDNVSLLRSLSNKWFGFLQMFGSSGAGYEATNRRFGFPQMSGSHGAGREQFKLLWSQE